ncbi:tRNA (guanine-N(7)-)-methyltransferase [bacterium MnTg02]|nr:tRNA (guanine-N(7)-)-methyltransferase [bacterium MnTg02]
MKHDISPAWPAGVPSKDLAMSRDYDETIADHYRKVAEQEGLSPTSTMADEIVRAMETDAITRFLDAAHAAKTGASSGTFRIADIGCGNGYTLGVLAQRNPEREFTGIEFSNELRALAETRVREDKLANVAIRPGDVRDPNFADNEHFDAAYCQRVLINLMDAADQRHALDNMIAKVKPGGALLFIEAFSSALNNLNEAREEFDLEPIPAAHHNLYLEDDFFTHPLLAPFESAAWSVPPNLLSTHYYVSRVLAPVLRRPKPFKRNSHLAKFLSEALPPAIGDYSQLRIFAFRKSDEG